MNDDIKYIYDHNGIPNAYIEENGKKYRVRVEVLIIKNNRVLLYKISKIDQYNRRYKIPGGSTEPGLSLEDVAKKECREEVRINIKNLKYRSKMKIEYTEIPKWQKEILWPLGLNYVGVIVYIYTAEYDSKYNGVIDENDRDQDMLDNSRFYSIEDPILSIEHKEVLKQYKKKGL